MLKSVLYALLLVPISVLSIFSVLCWLLGAPKYYSVDDLYAIIFADHDTANKLRRLSYYHGIEVDKARKAVLVNEILKKERKTKKPSKTYYVSFSRKLLLRTEDAKGNVVIMERNLKRF